VPRFGLRSGSVHGKKRQCLMGRRLHSRRFLPLSFRRHGAEPPCHVSGYVPGPYTERGRQVLIRRRLPSRRFLRLSFCRHGAEPPCHVLGYVPGPYTERGRQFLIRRRLHSRRFSGYPSADTGRSRRATFRAGYGLSASRCFRVVILFRVSICLTAMPIAFRVPTRTTSRRPRVIAV